MSYKQIDTTSKFNVTLTLKQLMVIEESLNLRTRIGIGQFDCIGDVIENDFSDKNERHHLTLGKYWDVRRKYLDPMKQELLGFISGESYGIASPEVSDRAKISYDMQKSFQQVIAKEIDYQSTSVWHNGDILHLGSEPRISLTKIKDDKNASTENNK